VNHRHGVERSIEALAARQFGVFAREQALELGVSRRVIERRIASGAWPLVRPGIHRIAAVPATRRQAIMAVSLWSAPGGLVSHLPAARVWGFDGDMANALHVTIDRSRRLRAADVVVHRVSNLLPADRARCGPVNVTSPLRTAVDLAAVVDVGTLEVAIESALRRRLFTRGQLRWRAEARWAPGGRDRRHSGDSWSFVPPADRRARPRSGSPVCWRSPAWANRSGSTRSVATGDWSPGSTWPTRRHDS
jgi:hypothetical protein